MTTKSKSKIMEVPVLLPGKEGTSEIRYIRVSEFPASTTSSRKALNGILVKIDDRLVLVSQEEQNRMYLSLPPYPQESILEPLGEDEHINAPRRFRLGARICLIVLKALWASECISGTTYQKSKRLLDPFIKASWLEEQRLDILESLEFNLWQKIITPGDLEDLCTEFHNKEMAVSHKVRAAGVKAKAAVNK